MITPSKPRLRSTTVEAFLRGMPNNPPHNALRDAVNRAIAEGSPIIENKPARAKRQAYDIRFRCTLNGCDWTTRIWLRSPEDCFEAMYNRLRFGQGTGQGKLRYGREFYRVVSCDRSHDQSRPSG